MTFEEVVDQALAMLQRRGRVTYRMLKRQFSLDDETLEDLKFELIEGQRLATDENGSILVWTGHTPPMPESTSTPIEPYLVLHDTPTLAEPPVSIAPSPSDANAGSSPCSSVMWSTRRAWHASSTRKTSARWCRPIKRPARR